MRSNAAIAILFLCAGGALEAQQTASGSSAIFSRLDPLHPPPPVPIPAQTPRRGPTAGDTDYMLRKNSLQGRDPNATGIPGIELAASSTRDPAPALIRALAAQPNVTWQGIPETIYAPPSPDLAAGPEDILLVVHSTIARYTKTGQQTSLMTFQQWFSGLIPTICPHGPANCVIFDPSVRYDPLHGRFIFVAFSSDNLDPGNNYWLVSVSNGATFAGGFNNFALDGTRNGTTQTANTVDYPQFGYDGNAVYLTGNMFDPFFSFAYVKIRILKKSELYNPATTTLTYQDIWDLRNQDNTKVRSLRAAQVRGLAGGGGTPPGIFINASDNLTADYLTLWRLANPLSANPTIARTTLGNLWTYSFPATAPQKNSIFGIDTGDSRVLKAVMRNGVLYTARNAGYTNAPSTVTFDRIDLNTNLVTLQARLINGNFFYPIFDLPASIGPGNAISDKLIAGSTTDAGGALTFPGIPDVKAGEDAYELFARPGVPAPVWGDYFGGAVDPVQGGLWAYGEYSKPKAGFSGHWGTWAGYFPWATSGQFTDVAASNPSYDFINVMRQWSITSGCTATAYCPGDSVTRGQMAVFLIRAITGEPPIASGVPYFTDVPPTHPYFTYIQRLRDLGITTGCTATKYCPDSNVTRSEMAVFLVRGKLSGLSGDNFTFPQTAYFADVPATDPRFSFVQKLRELGITTGCTASSYCPEQFVTREQMAVFIVRAFLN